MDASVEGTTSVESAEAPVWVDSSGVEAASEIPGGPYYLARDVYVCVTTDYPVLFDLRRDHYAGVTRGQTQILSKYVSGWPQTHDGDPRILSPQAESSPPTEVDSVLKRWIDRGWLTRDANAGKPAQPLALERPHRALIEWELDSRPRVRAADWVGFIRAILIAKYSLKHQALFEIVERVRIRKAQRGRDAERLDVERVRSLVGAFLCLRPLLFAGRSQCLLDSLALLEFLAPHGIFPTWVFGVQTRPWAAHCWIQTGDTVWNDLPENVRRTHRIAGF
jgi:Transglutaminase-like superfamily